MWMEWAQNSVYDYSSSSKEHVYSIQVRLSSEAGVSLFRKCSSLGYPRGTIHITRMWIIHAEAPSRIRVSGQISHFWRVRGATAVDVCQDQTLAEHQAPRVHIQLVRERYLWTFLILQWLYSLELFPPTSAFWLCNSPQLHYYFNIIYIEYYIQYHIIGILRIILL